MAVISRSIRRAALMALPLGLLWSMQQPAVQLSLRRTFGYAFRGDIQGSFVLSLEGPPSLERARFYLDDRLLATVDDPPFQIPLHTGDHPLGPHQLRAEGDLASGEVLASNVIQTTFVSAGAGSAMVASIVKPVFIVLGLALVLSVLFVALSPRRYRAGVYGAAGGAVCPGCGLPMSRHWFSPNLGAGKLERCPHCGRWSVVRRAPADDLAQAEARWRGDSPSTALEEDADRKKRQIDDSRYLE